MDLCEVWTHSLWKVRDIKIQFFNNFGGVLSIDLGHAGLNTFSCLVCMNLNNHMFSEKKQGRKSILKFEEEH